MTAIESGRDNINTHVNAGPHGSLRGLSLSLSLPLIDLPEFLLPLTYYM
jgi:hypothetical protein